MLGPIQSKLMLFAAIAALLTGGTVVGGALMELGGTPTASASTQTINTSGKADQLPFPVSATVVARDGLGDLQLRPGDIDLEAVDAAVMRHAPQTPDTTEKGALVTAPAPAAIPAPLPLIGNGPLTIAYETGAPLVIIPDASGNGTIVRRAPVAIPVATTPDELINPLQDSPAYQLDAEDFWNRR